MYTAYVLTEESRSALLEKYPPKYKQVIAHHVTVQFGVPKSTTTPNVAEVKVVGYADSKDGIEALVVSVDGELRKEDGNFYHITLSLDPAKYKPKDSNDLIGYGKYTLSLPTYIVTVPEVLG